MYKNLSEYIDLIGILNIFLIIKYLFVIFSTLTLNLKLRKKKEKNILFLKIYKQRKYNHF
jgi:hypothetical protein